MRLDALLGDTAKDRVLADAAAYWNPDKTSFWQQSGIDLVIGRREGYRLYDVSGRRLIDVHLNGGTYNLGHRNPELVALLREGVERFDIGNHHFPSIARSALARELIRTSPTGMSKVAFAAAGGEAIDLAIKSARAATGRRVVVSVVKAYHGHTGLAVAAGDARFSERFVSDRPDEFVQVPFNDPEAMAEALAAHDVAAVLMETIPATYGFPLPEPGYLEEVARLCREAGALYIADEVQTGLLRTGELWGISRHGIVPDILVTAKGLSGGLYPISAVLLGERAARWLHDDGFAHMSTFGGAELGCVVALGVLEITTRPEVRENVTMLTQRFGEGLRRLRGEHAPWLRGIRQAGLVIGLEFDADEGAKAVMRALYERGVWAIFSTLDPRVLQFKPGLLLTAEDADEILGILDDALRATRRLARGEVA